jgi:hypothetical protein
MLHLCTLFRAERLREHKGAQQQRASEKRCSCVLAFARNGHKPTRTLRAGTPQSANLWW